MLTTKDTVVEKKKNKVKKKKLQKISRRYCSNDFDKEINNFSSGPTHHNSELNENLRF